MATVKVCDECGDQVKVGAYYANGATFSGEVVQIRAAKKIDLNVRIQVQHVDLPSGSNSPPPDLCLVCLADIAERVRDTILLARTKGTSG